jgi:hypothetical protein
MAFEKEKKITMQVTNSDITTLVDTTTQDQTRTEK